MKANHWRLLLLFAIVFPGISSYAEDSKEAAPAIDWNGTWIETPAGKPVIDRGAKGSWEHLAVDNPYLFVNKNRLYCFYEAQDLPLKVGGHERIGLAVSTDGLHWDKEPSNPILEVGSEGSWDHVVSKLPMVFGSDHKFYMFYSGRDRKTKQIGLAQSADLIHWKRMKNNPVLKSRPDHWDRFLSTYPAAVVQKDSKYYLLYRGMKKLYAQQGVGLAVSSDLIHWQRAHSEVVISVDEEIASFAVAHTQAGFIGISQSTQRNYWASHDLVHWKKGPVAKFDGPKVDTLSNPVFFRGQWMLVYEQNDRIYRAVLKSTK